MAVLKYGTYKHSPTPEVVMRSQRVGLPGGARQGTRRTWEIRARLTGSSPSDLKSQIDALEAAYASDGEDLVLYDNDEVSVLDQLQSSTALHGTRVVRRPQFPAGKGAQYATIRDVEIVVEAIYLSAGAPFSDAWGVKRETVRLLADGTSGVTIAGEYTGETLQAARDAAEAAKEGSYLAVSETTTESADEKKVSFTYEYIDASSSREVIEFSEEIGVEQTFRRRVFRTVLDGSGPIEQETCLMPARAWQRGRAVGRTGYPDFPAYKWSSSLLASPPRKSMFSPRRLASGLTEYPISWEYDFASTSNVGFDPPTPGVPPDGSS